MPSNFKALSITTTSPLGEGNFREFAVTRLLYDVVDGTGSETPTGYTSFTDNISGQFNQIWAALTKTTEGGFRQSTVAFRNVGVLHLAQQRLSGGGDWTAIRAGNFHLGSTAEYAQYVTTGGTCATVGTSYNYSINPTFAASSLSSSNLFVDNDFYHVNVATAGSYTLTLKYKESTSVQKADLDLYLYNSDAVFGNSADMVVRNIDDPTTAAGVEQVVTATVTLNPGNYLLNVNAYTGGAYANAPVTYYSLSISGPGASGVLCPTSL